MINHHNQIKKILSEQINQAIKKSYPDFSETHSPYELLGVAPEFNLGHYAYPCFILAKLLKSNPVKVALDLSQNLVSIDPDFFTSIKNQGPYVNFCLTNEAYAKLEIENILNGQFFKKSLSIETPKTMIEYSQPNTHKELHVGHMRNLCLGSALINLHRYAGYNIVAATFPGDVGTHVAKCLWYMKYHNNETPPKMRKGAWLGRMYSIAHNKLEDERGSDKEITNREQLTSILKELEKKSGPFYDLWKDTREWSIELMKEVYNWANTKFDVWYWESDVDAQSLKLALDYFEKGLFIKSEGAIGIDLEAYKLGFCMLVKSDGNGLYATKDIELARRKFEEHKIERSIYIVDKRQSLHFSQVFKTLELMGFENAKNCYHLQYDFVELPDGAMSSRKGNIVPLQELIDRMVAMIKTEYLQKYNDSWSEEEIHTTANMVAQGAIKYGMIRVDNNRKIVFDMKEWLRLDGESGPYIQYSYARIHSLTLKLNYDPNTPINFRVLVHPLEIKLLKTLTDFNDVVVVAAEQYKTSALCSYLYDLGKLFNSFYAECSVGNAETMELKQARLALCTAIANVLEHGLNLLGIPAPKKM